MAYLTDPNQNKLLLDNPFGSYLGSIVAGSTTATSNANPILFFFQNPVTSPRTIYIKAVSGAIHYYGGGRINWTV